MQVSQRVKLKESHKYLLTIPGIGRVLSLTIMLETGDMYRFEKVGNYVSYGRVVGLNILRLLRQVREGFC